MIGPDQIAPLRWPRRTRITPTTMQSTDGQNVKKKSKPGPIGLGFGSGHSPTCAATMIAKSGAAPSTSKVTPTRTHQERK